MYFMVYQAGSWVDKGSVWVNEDGGSSITGISLPATAEAFRLEVRATKGINAQGRSIVTGKP